jgi:hypothetical protein
MARHVNKHPANKLLTPLEAELLVMLLAVVTTIAAMILKQHHL